jgi:ATP-dependent Clp protease ATP-binding subunit ClpC
MFERFTDRARRSVVLSQEEARSQDHNYIGTEHMLLGLLAEDVGVAARALKASGLTIEAARLAVVELIGPGSAPSSGHIPYTPRSKKVLELALRESLQLGHNYIGTEHLLLALLREGEGMGAQVIAKLGADLNGVRMAVLKILRDEPRVSVTLNATDLRVSSVDPELRAMRLMIEALEPLDVVTRDRVLTWASARLEASRK